MNNLLTLLNEKWSALESSDQRALKIGGGAAGLILFFGLIILPMHQSLKKMNANLPALRQQLSVMGMQAIEAKRLRAQPTSTASGASLLSNLEKSVNRNGIKPNVQNLTPRDDHTASLQVTGINYSKLVQWLAQLDTQRVARLSEVEMRKTDTPGLVDATLVFTTGN